MSKLLIATQAEIELFAKVLGITYDKVKIKKNGYVIFHRNSDEFGIGYPGFVAPPSYIKNTAAFVTNASDGTKG